MVPLSRPHITEAEVTAVTEVLRAGWPTNGPKTTEFENRVAHYLGVKHAIAMNSATSALYLALVAQDIRGDVILPSFTFAATANAVVTAGATPVFADIEPDTCNLDPDDLSGRITPATEAVIVVHYAGHPARMDRIMAIAEKYHLAVIEDAAGTLGGEWQGRKAGSFATAAFSFFPTQNINCGEGGMLTTNDDVLACRVRTLAAHGIPTTTAERERSMRPWYRTATVPGYNFRLSNLLSAIGVEQMRKIDLLNGARRRHARFFNENLAPFEELVLPTELPDAKHVYQMYTVRVDGVERDVFVRALRERGVAASVYFDPPVHLHECYREPYARLQLPVTENAASTIVTLPMFPSLTHAERDEVIESVENVLLKLPRTEKQCA